MSDGLNANIFLGIIIDEKLQKQLDECDPYNERFFKVKDPEYLQLSTFEGQSVIGKRLEKKVNVQDLDNILKNVLSILKKICPDFYFSQEQFVLFSEISIG